MNFNMAPLRTRNIFTVRFSVFVFRLMVSPMRKDVINVKVMKDEIYGGRLHKFDSRDLM